jgi:glycerol-3-phosphate cytidylyltransferase
MKIGFTCGAFDLCHAGHILMFEECKQHCDYLIVGLQTDPSIDRPDKNKPIQTYEERGIQVAAIKYIDEIVSYSTEADLYSYLQTHPPDVRFLGADWEGKEFTGHDLPIPVIFNSRNHTFSSSELRKRIFTAEYEKYFPNPWKDD